MIVHNAVQMVHMALSAENRGLSNSDAVILGMSLIAVRGEKFDQLDGFCLTF